MPLTHRHRGCFALAQSAPQVAPLDAEGLGVAAARTFESAPWLETKPTFATRAISCLRSVPLWCNADVNGAYTALAYSWLANAGGGRLGGVLYNYTRVLLTLACALVVGIATNIHNVHPLGISFLALHVAFLALACARLAPAAADRLEARVSLYEAMLSTLSVVLRYAAAVLDQHALARRSVSDALRLAANVTLLVALALTLAFVAYDVLRASLGRLACPAVGARRERVMPRLRNPSAGVQSPPLTSATGPAPAGAMDAPAHSVEASARAETKQQDTDADAQPPTVHESFAASRGAPPAPGSVRHNLAERAAACYASDACRSPFMVSSPPVQRPVATTSAGAAAADPTVPSAWPHCAGRPSPMPSPEVLSSVLALESRTSSTHLDLAPGARTENAPTLPTSIAASGAPTRAEDASTPCQGSADAFSALRHSTPFFAAAGPSTMAPSPPLAPTPRQPKLAGMEDAAPQASVSAMRSLLAPAPSYRQQPCFSTPRADSHDTASRAPATSALPAGGPLHVPGTSARPAIAAPPIHHLGSWRRRSQTRRAGGSRRGSGVGGAAPPKLLRAHSSTAELREEEELARLRQQRRLARSTELAAQRAAEAASCAGAMQCSALADPRAWLGCSARD